MNFKPARLLLALLAVVALPVFAQNLAVVNGKPIPAARADAMYKALVAQNPGQEAPASLHDDIKKVLIRDEVLTQEAEKQGLTKSEVVKLQLNAARQSVITNAVLAEYFKKNPITEKDIQAEYDAAKAAEGDKEYHVRHIQFDNEADATAAIAKLKGGAKFDELAKASKDVGSAANGGDLDWVRPARFAPAMRPFTDAMTSLQKGQITETPVHTPAGYHVLKLDDTRAFAFPPIDGIKQQVFNAVQQKRSQAYEEELVKKAVVTNK